MKLTAYNFNFFVIKPPCTFKPTFNIDKHSRSGHNKVLQHSKHIILKHYGINPNKAQHAYFSSKSPIIFTNSVYFSKLTKKVLNFSQKLVIFIFIDHNKDAGHPIMQEREARLLSESGDLDKVVIAPTGNNIGWTLMLVAKNGDEQMLNSKRSKEPRVFKTSDASLRCCLRIGVNQAIVNLT